MNCTHIQITIIDIYLYGRSDKEYSGVILRQVCDKAQLLQCLTIETIQDCGGRGVHQCKSTIALSAHHHLTPHRSLHSTGRTSTHQTHKIILTACQYFEKQQTQPNPALTRLQRSLQHKADIKVV